MEDSRQWVIFQLVSSVRCKQLLAVKTYDVNKHFGLGLILFYEVSKEKEYEIQDMERKESVHVRVTEDRGQN